MVGKVKQLKDEGKAMPKDYQQLEKEFGEHCLPCKDRCRLPTHYLLVTMLTHCSVWLVMRGIILNMVPPVHSSSHVDLHARKHHT